ncbi:MAG: S-layer homology domain-containing protein [Clostridia bacterium]|nr:S-layer homology domain-containing protein [Clostridia bacterium]
MNFEATSGDGIITVTWDELEEKDVSYVVYSSDADVFSYTIDELLDANKKYDIKICAVNSVGYGKYGVFGTAPEITGISFKTDSTAYNAETNTFTVSQTEPFVVYLTGANFESVDESFLNYVHFGFVPSVEKSENVLGASLSEFKEAGITADIDSNENKISLTFDYAAIVGFLGDESAFEGIGYGDINSFNEDDIIAVNIAAEALKKEFSDVHLINHWAKDNIDYVYENGLMNGTDETHFALDMPLTRAMLVTILYRVEGEPQVSGITSYADLKAGQYYLDAVCWAQLSNIANGISDTEFVPNDNITREQIAAIMFRYAQYKGYDLSAGENTNILSYDDFSAVSEYAISSIQWALGSGLMKGKSASTLNPKENATRAEAAAILERFIKSDFEEAGHECEEIAILYTNDVHCGIEDNIGYAGLAAYKKETEALYDYVTLADCGDAVQGDLVGTVSDGEYIVDIMNELDYDFAVLGNHEFDYGMEQLSSLIEKSNAQYLGCNISYTGKNKNLLEKVKPYKILEYGDTKVAFIGVTTPESYTKSTPTYFMEDGEYVYELERGNDGKDLYDNVQKYVDECENQGADYIIVLAHLGDAEESSPYTSVELIEATDGIDVVLDGHSHSRHINPVICGS